jgi:class 3 adenylate cyclase
VGSASRSGPGSTPARSSCGGEDIAGLAVHIGARVAALAGPGEVLVSGTVPPLVAGSGLEFSDRGSRELKGVPGAWNVFAVQPPALSEFT